MFVGALHWAGYGTVVKMLKSELNIEFKRKTLKLLILRPFCFNMICLVFWCVVLLTTSATSNLFFIFQQRNYIWDLKKLFNLPATE